MKVETKVWWRSKTLWLNFIAVIATVIQAKYGLILDPSTQGIILATLNVFFRVVTKEPLGLIPD
jgi:hypothetical protein